MKSMMSPGNRMFFILLIAFAATTVYFGAATVNGALLAAAAVQIVLIAAASLVYRRQMVKRRRGIARYIDQLTANMDGAGKDSAAHCPIPMLIVKVETGELIWANEPFHAAAGMRERFFSHRLSDVLPDFDFKWLSHPGGTSSAVLRGRSYEVCGSLIRQPGGRDRRELLAALYFTDVTELVGLRREYRLSRPVVSVVMIDNYDECVKNLSESQKSGILAAADDKITAWAAPFNGLLRKYDRDKYLLLFEERDLAGLAENRFSVLDDIRAVIGSSGLPVTLSIGIGRDGESFTENFSFAQLAIDMALSRGGDQAVVKNRVTFDFFGGRSKEVEKRTKVKSRVVASSLSRIIGDSSSVFVMGHAYSDIDSLGAAAGVVCIARKCGKRAHIVIDESKTMASSLLARIRDQEAYAGLFIDEQTALLYADNKSLLVVVDCNRPEIVEFPGFLRSMTRVAVIDHHRRAADYIDTALLVMHEPYASSASELVCELIQYICRHGDLLRCEAEAMMAGIVLDTKGFTMHTGMRTFEAAAFLRGAGADPVEIKRLFQNDMQSSIERYEIITKARAVRNGIAVAALDRETDRAIAAQAADEMLNIIGIDASFVLYRSRTGTDISGRSLDTINVQMILEKLGGGGHQTVAGAQLKDTGVPQALELLIQVINQYCDEIGVDAT
ncbi:MAG: DHH family phosphoesterase [Oscillospiraceae bacterium]|nr:DHH family phosphoesterase [Oscillospiraceae bacterium]